MMSLVSTPGPDPSARAAINFILPTGDRSYRSGEKKRLSNASEQPLAGGRWPHHAIDFHQRIELGLVVSIRMAFEIYGPRSRSLMYNVSMASIPAV